MVAVPFLEEVVGLVSEDGRCLLVVLRREDPAGLDEGLQREESVLCLLSEESTYRADERVGSLEPRAELFVGSSVVLELRDSVEETVEGTTAGEALQENAELVPRLLHNRVICEHALSGTSFLLARRLGGIEVPLERVEEPVHRSLVRTVRLTFGNDLDK